LVGGIFAAVPPLLLVAQPSSLAAVEPSGWVEEVVVVDGSLGVELVVSFWLVDS
jgi:hypothetical protein